MFAKFFRGPSLTVYLQKGYSMKKIFALLSVVFIALSAQANQSIEINTSSLHAQEDTQHRTIDRYTYNFGRVWLNSSQYASYRLTNTGDLPLTFLSASISGADYSASHSCVGVLQPNQVCQFDIRYSPFFTGFSSGRFVLSFVEDLDIVVDLWGEGYR